MKKQVIDWLLDREMEAFNPVLLNQEATEEEFKKLIKNGQVFSPRYYSK